MSGSSELGNIKRMLLDNLGDNTKIYLGLLKSWFTNKLSKEDFDHQARKLVPQDKVYLHNQFLLEIFTRCQLSIQSYQTEVADSCQSSRVCSSASVSSIVQQMKGAKRQFDSNPLLLLMPVTLHVPEANDRSPGFASRDLLLPDVGMIQGRTLVVAWDIGLDDVATDVVSLLVTAVQMQLKAILTKVISRRHSFKLREKKFRYGFRSQTVPSTIRQCTQLHRNHEDSEVLTSFTDLSHGPMPAFRPNWETAYRDAAVEVASVSPSSEVYPVSLFDMLETLQIHKSCIPSHTVYSITMERIINRLWHPSREELSASKLCADILKSSSNNS